MRIIHTCLRYPPATGGVETYVQQLVERTRNIDEGRDVRVLTSKLRTHGPLSTLDPNLLLDDPPYVQRLHHASTLGVSYPRLQALPYYIGHHQPDIIHGYSFWYQPADVAARYAKRHRVPFIYHPMYYENVIRRKPIWQLYKRTIGAKTLDAADIVAVLSSFEQKLLEQAGFANKRYVVLPPGVDMPPAAKSGASFFETRGIKGKVLLTVGRIDAAKGLEDIIAALPALLKEFPELQLVVVGEDFGGQSEYQSLAQRLGVTPHVRWLGRLTAAELQGAYQEAELFIHPSHYEAFGIVLIEAMSHGVPVVARRAAAIPFVVPHEEVGLLFNSQSELLSCIRALLSNSKLCQQYGQAGRMHVQRNFTWDQSIKRLLKLYAELKREK